MPTHLSRLLKPVLRSFSSLSRPARITAFTVTGAGLFLTALYAMLSPALARTATQSSTPTSEPFPSATPRPTSTPRPTAKPTTKPSGKSKPTPTPGPATAISDIAVRRLSDETQTGAIEIGTKIFTLGKVMVGRQVYPLTAISNSTTKQFEIRVQNVGRAPGAFLLSLSRPAKNWTFKLTNPSAPESETDLATAAQSAKKLSLPVLKPGERLVLRLEAQNSKAPEPTEISSHITSPRDRNKQYIAGLSYSSDGNHWYSVTQKPIQIQRHATLGLRAQLSDGPEWDEYPIGPKWTGMDNEVEGKTVWLTPAQLKYAPTATVIATLNNTARAQVRILPDAFPEIEVDESYSVLSPGEKASSAIPITVRVLDEDDQAIAGARIRLRATPADGRLQTQWPDKTTSDSIILTTGKDGVVQVEWHGLLTDASLAKTLKTQVQLKVEVIDSFEQAFGDTDDFELDVYPKDKENRKPAG